jgi:hypothetical protein
MIGSRRRRAVAGVSVFLVTVLSVAACRRKDAAEPAVARVSVSVNRERAPLGSPVDFTYRFAVASGAHFAEDYKVMVHVVDADEQMIFAFDHAPAVPTTAWKPGQTVEYTRTEFLPLFPYVGEAAIHVGLYSTNTQKRLPLEGDHVGQRAYKVARLQLQPQTENVYTVFKEGWHPAEVAEHNALVQWQWTKKDATLVFRNPKKDSTFYLDVDNPGGVFNEAQHVRVLAGDRAIDEFSLVPKQQLLRRIPLKAAQLGGTDMVELHIEVDKTFVPALVTASNSKDPRELGVRVFHAFVQPND